MSAIKIYWDDVTSMGLQVGVLVVLLALLGVVFRRSMRLDRAVLAVAATTIMTFALFVSFPSLEEAVLAWFGVVHSHWNWGGKILSIMATLALIAVIPGVSWKEAGFQWTQNRGVGPALMGCLLICALLWGANFALGDHGHPKDAESLAFQATMPGLQEESSWRGLMLLLLSQTFKDKPWTVLGAPIGWGSILSAVYFGLGHGMGWADGRLVFDAVAVAITGIVGLMFVWIKERTGSLVLPVITHNIANLGSFLLF